MNHTDERIKKLHAKGLSLEQIANKIGRPGNIERVVKALKRADLVVDAMCGKPDYDGLCKESKDE